MHSLADWLIELVRSVPSWAVYVVACGVVYAETATLVAGLVMPSEALLLAAGVAAAVGPTEIGVLVVAACVAAVAGDTTGYWIGRRSGGWVKSTRAGQRFGADRWARAEASVNRDGILAVATGRWIGFVRTLVPPVAGMTRMNVGRFWLADGIGAVSWVTTVLLVGYFAGAALGATVLFYAAVVTGALMAGWLGYRWWRGRAAPSTVDVHVPRDGAEC